MTPGIFLLLVTAQEKSSAAQHRFLWVRMSETVFWVAVAAVAVGIVGFLVAVVRARRRARERK